jgi:uncharacterized RDD family membrane protein YckC
MSGWQIFVEVPGKPPAELRPGESIVGRSRTAQVCIPESTVSRQHARLIVGGLGEVSLEDLGSSNGTFVNGERIQGRLKVSDGDRILVGDAELRLRIVPPVAPAEATVRLTLPPLGGPPPPAPLPIAAPPRAAGSVSAPPFASPPPPHSGAVAAPPLRPPAPTAPVPPPSFRPPPLPPRTEAPSWSAAPLLSPPGGSPPPEPVRPPESPRETRAIPVEPHAPPPLPTYAPPSPSREIPRAPEPPPPVAAPAPARRGDMLPSVTGIDRIPIPEPTAGALEAARLARARPAGFWIRVLAVLLDSVILAFASIPVWAAAMFALSSRPALAATLASALLGLVYLVYPVAFWASRGATPGKSFLNLRIVKGAPSSELGLGWGTAILRALGYLASGVLLGIGYLLVAFTSQKQGLHDLIAGTRVLRLR